MRPLTDHKPKPLLAVGGKPLIVHHLESLSRSGFERVIINHAHLGKQIEHALGNGESWNLEIRYSAEGQGQALETGGGICKALPLLGEHPFLVINGDVYTDFNFTHIRLPKGRLGHLVMVDNPEHHPQGDFMLREDSVKDQGSPKLTFSGIGVYHPRLFENCPAMPFPLAPLLRQHMATDRISGEYFDGFWLDVGTPERYQLLDRMLSHGSRNQS